MYKPVLRGANRVMESSAQQKSERQLAKVERKRWYMQWLSALQILFGPPYMAWTLFDEGAAVHERSLLTYFVSGIGLLWSLAGCIGVYAVTARRVQALVVFTSIEIFLTMITSCATAALLLLHLSLIHI